MEYGTWNAIYEASEVILNITPILALMVYVVKFTWFDKD